MDNNEALRLKGNIMVCGKAGVGKTVLINSIIGAETGKTGTGAPVTTEVTSYSASGSPFVLYDTPGFEIKQNQVHEAIDKYYTIIKNLQKTMDSDQMIDIILYCVCYQGALRFEEDEALFISRLKNDLKIPVCVVFTQYANKPDSWEHDEYKRDVKRILEKNGCVLADNYFRPVLCYDMPIYGGAFTLPAYGLSQIVDLILNEMICNQANKLAEAKYNSLDDACERAKKWVLFYSSVVSAEVAIIALPGADLLALASTEGIMAAHIYDIIFEQSKIGEFDKNKVVETLSTLGVPLLGYIGGPIAFNEAVRTITTVAAPFTGGVSEVPSVLVGSVVGFGVAYALGNATIDILKKLSMGSITLEQIENKDPKVMAVAGKRAKEEYKIGRKYAKEHPESICKSKVNSKN